MQAFSILTAETKELWPADYGLPENHCVDVLHGSYDVPYSPATPPTILDLGANVGAFTRWAVKRWPGCTIYAYEPHPGNFALLLRTVTDLLTKDERVNVICDKVAVADQAGTLPLKFSGFNCGEWTLMDMSGAKDVKTVNVEVIPASTLPRADILKIDTEGAEVMILNSLAPRLKEFSAIMMECHGAPIVEPIIAGLASHGFTLTGKTVHAEHRVELRFVRGSLLPKQGPTTLQDFLKP